ncbi:hypothetical protein LVJ83_08830 [Uruburuella testudinis]|uniref:Uncharacterized protein n=1 Tax=Uruburuella testudinis TaxID=1282863 RepID=A0ABY4DPU5_9NEIS|nr:hypothetical protein [Uruburuella testudinis]UOO81079.1 hypothetical protein LVJ83_08830 [Uruburuella testudinis]
MIENTLPFDNKHHPSSLPKISDDSTLPLQAHQAKKHFFRQSGKNWREIG